MSIIILTWFGHGRWPAKSLGLGRGLWQARQRSGRCVALGASSLFVLPDDLTVGALIAA